MINKPFSQINKEDIESLIANEVKEGRTLEYKEALPGGKNDDKKEFLADVSSFANSSGGELFYGVTEKRDNSGKGTGIPECAPGLVNLNADAEILRLENMIRDGIKPRIAGIHLRAVEGFLSGPVLLVGIPKSYVAPHMVTFQDHSRFYSRNNAGKYPMDVSEIRSAFALSASLPERIRSFRDERLARIVADETPLPLRRGPGVVLHIIPIVSFDVATGVDLGTLENFNNRVAPMGSSSWQTRYNLDGLFLHRSNTETRACESYFQIFRNGIIEAVNFSIVEPNVETKLIPIKELEINLFHHLGNYLAAQRDLGLEPPVIVLVSFLGVKGWAIPRRGASKGPIDRDALLLPDVFVEDYATNPVLILHPVLDALWQAAGWARCLDYDDQGKWIAGQEAG